MKTHSFFPALLVVSIITLVLACNKDTVVSNEEPVKTSESDILYQLDGKIISEVEFFSVVSQEPKILLRDKELALQELAKTHELLFEVGKKVNGKDKTVINAFKTKKERDSYIVANSMDPLLLLETAVNHLSYYAEINGYLMIYESTGIMPQAYLNYEDSYLTSMGIPHIKESTVETRTLTNMVYKGCDLQESNWPVKWSPALAMWTYNNNISSFFPLGILGGVTRVFDRVFYKEQILGPIWTWANQRIDFCIYPFTTYNNRASSWAAI